MPWFNYTTSSNAARSSQSRKTYQRTEVFPAKTKEAQDFEKWEILDPSKRRKPADQHPSPFFRLPSELRVRIFHLALPPPTTIHVNPHSENPAPPSLLRTCQRFYQEAGVLYYGENKFVLDVAHKFIRFLSFAKKVRYLLGDEAVPTLGYIFGEGMAQHDKEEWMKKYHPFRKP